MAFRYFFLLVLVLYISLCTCEFCPKQCDCDIENGLNRATCVNQNIVYIDIGVPKPVQVYSLSHNAITEINNFCFKESGYTSIEILNLSDNLIFWIGLHAFFGLEKLTHLDISNNRLRFIPSDLFWDTPLLNALDLSGNIFEELKNEPFLMHTNIQILNLNNCRIKMLPERLFSRLPNLSKLDLSGNYMISLSTEVLRPLRKLKRLELKNEYWHCTPEFIAVETWIVSRQITYKKQCMAKQPKMLEKMISMVTEKEDVDINKVWNITTPKNVTHTTEKPKRPLTPFEKFDSDFPAFQSFIIGIEIGLGIGIVGTYIWLRKFCTCGQLSCIRPERRRQTRRIQRAGAGDDTSMSTSLLWNSVLSPDLQTPPTLRRDFSLPDRAPPFAPYGLPITTESTVRADAVRLPDRSETPPPPYNECRLYV